MFRPMRRKLPPKAVDDKGNKSNHDKQAKEFGAVTECVFIHRTSCQKRFPDLLDLFCLLFLFHNHFLRSCSASLYMRPTRPDELQRIS